jgi:acetyl esterase/lipase
VTILITLLIVFVILWLIALFVLRGEDLSRYDGPPDPAWARSFPGHEGPSKEHWEAVAAIEKFGLQALGLSRKERLKFMRKFMDDMGLQKEYESEFRPVEAAGVPAEWVLPPGADSRRRILYLHGGAFIAGSPVSHRNITNRFAVLAGAAVLAIDYRLMPEHRRIDGIEDCRAAYRWILENGPDGPAPLDYLAVAGDSAGGNLTLSLIAWVRDQGLRPPDAAVALSPTVDGTFSSPSIAANIESDIMLGPLFSFLMKIPKAIRRFMYVLENRFNPANPVVSPVFGELSGLPPTLIQVSEAEMLLDDARRYVNKARSAGSPASLQSWGHMLHVWQMFYPELPEARTAFEEIGRFLESADTRRGKDAPGGVSTS